MTLADSPLFLEHYGVVILPALAVAEQIGIPIPAVPALLAVGVLAAHSRMSIPPVLGAIAIAALVADLAWYELGRRRGATMLKTLCRVSVEPDSCLRRAATIFARYGAPSLLAAKFVPGLTTIVPPLAGVYAVKRLRFVAYDLAGVLLWAGTWLAVGYFFSNAIISIIVRVTELGQILGLVIVASLAGYLLVKYGRRRNELKRKTTSARPDLGVRRLSELCLALQALPAEPAQQLTIPLEGHLIEIRRNRGLGSERAEAADDLAFEYFESPQLVGLDIASNLSPHRRHRLASPQNHRQDGQ